MGPRGARPPGLAAPDPRSARRRPAEGGACILPPTGACLPAQPLPPASTAVGPTWAGRRYCSEWEPQFFEEAAGCIQTGGVLEVTLKDSEGRKRGCLAAVVKEIFVVNQDGCCIVGEFLAAQSQELNGWLNM